MAEPVPPVVVDGDGRTGTVVDKAWHDDLVEWVRRLDGGFIGLPYGAEIAAEVVAARGNEASLNARINGVVDADGAFIVPDALASVDDLMGLMGENLCPNPLFAVCARGVGPQATYGPTGWVSFLQSVETTFPSYKNRGIVRVVTSSDNQSFYSWPGLTYFSRHGILEDILYGIPGAPGLTFGAYVKTSAPGVTAYVGNENSSGVSAAHPGDGAWHWLASDVMYPTGATHTYTCGLQIAQAATVEITKPCLRLSRRPASAFIPPKVRRSLWGSVCPGDDMTLFAGRKMQFLGPGDGLLTHLTLGCTDASNDRTLTLQLHRYNFDTSAWVAVESVTLPINTLLAGSGGLTATQELRSSVPGPGALDASPHTPSGVPTKNGQLWAVELTLGAGATSHKNVFFNVAFRLFDSPLFDLVEPLA